MSRHRLSPSLAGDYLILIGPYDEAFVALLKEAVPARAREWRPTAKCWRIDPEFEAEVRRIIDPPEARQEIRGSWVPGEEAPRLTSETVDKVMANAPGIIAEVEEQLVTTCPMPPRKRRRG